MTSDLQYLSCLYNEKRPKNIFYVNFLVKIIQVKPRY